MLCRRLDLSPTDGAELWGCVNMWWLGVVWVCVTSSQCPVHRRVMNSKLFCKTTVSGFLFLFRNSLSGRWWLYFVCTSDLSGNNNSVKPRKCWSVRPVRLWGMRTLLRVSVMFSWNTFLNWACLVHLKLEAQPYRFSRMGLSLLFCWLWHCYLPLRFNLL